MHSLFDRRLFLRGTTAAVATPLAFAAGLTPAALNPAASAGVNADSVAVRAIPLVRLSANENPYGPGPAARAAIASATQEACRYDSGDMQRLIDAVAAHEAVSRDHIALGAGSGELLNNLALSYCERGQLVCAWPTFGQIMSFAEKLGCDVRKIPVDSDLRHDLGAMNSAISPNTSLVYICNPNNPTGTVVAGADLREFCSRQAERTLVVVDEAYIDLVDDGTTASMVDLVRDGANVVVLRTFSKIHGLAGLRMGYAIAHTEVAARLRRNQLTYPSIIAMRAAHASLGDTPYLTHTRAALLADRRRFAAACREIGLRYAEPQGNFLFVQVGMPVDEFRKRMRERNVEVGRAFEPFIDWCRITVGTTTETTACLAALRAVLKT